MGTWSGYSERGTGSQERGPSSFALQTPGTQQAQQPGMQAVAVNAGVRGQNPGNTAATVNIDPNSDRTLQALVKMGESIMAPKMAELKNQRFMQGMVAAASGQALTEIVNEQPWYSKIFGDGPVVEGARAWSVQSKVDEWATQQELAMPELAKKPASEIAGYLTEQGKQFMTGDPELDVQVQANMLRVAPQLIKAHARANYKYNQEQASITWHSSKEAAGAMYEAAARNPDTPYEDLNGMRSNVLAGLSPITGQNLESWEKSVKLHIQSQIQQGNFHTAQLYADTILPQLPPQEQTQFAQQLKTWGTYHKAAQGGEWLMKAESLEAQLHAGKLSVDDYTSKIKELNTGFTRATANPVPLRSDAEIAAIAGRGEQRAYSVHAARMAEAQREADHAAKLGNVEAAKQMTVAATMESLSAGSVAFVNAKTADKEAAFASLMNAAKTEEERQAIVVKAAALNYVDDTYRASVTQPLRLSGRDTPDDNFMLGYAKWQQLNYTTGPNGQPVARPGAAEASAKLYGELNPKMALFHSMMANGKVNGEFTTWAYQSAFVLPPIPTRLDRKSREEASKAVQTLVQDNDSWLTALNPFKAKPDDYSMKTIERMIMPFVSQLEDRIPGNEKYKMALAMAKNSNLEIVRGDDVIHAFSKPNTAEPLAIVLERNLGIPASQHGPSIERAFRAKLDSLEDKPDGAQWMRVADVNGQPSFLGWWVKSDGSNGTVHVTGDEIQNAYKASYSKKSDSRTFVDNRLFN